MIKKALANTLPLLPYAGTFGVFSACGCGQCPACLGASASVIGLALLVGTRKLLSVKSKKHTEGA